MSNDIRPDFISHVGAKNSVNNDQRPLQTNSNNANLQEESKAQGAMDILSAQGYAQVNMDKTYSNNGVINSIEAFKNNPDLIDSYIYFCDSLIDKGYSLESAIASTDRVFAALKDENLYR